MSLDIRLKHSSTLGKVPLPTDLVAGELALNTADVKAYMLDAGGAVVQLAGSGADATKVDKAGDTMAGQLKLVGDPVADADAARKKYVDDQVAAGDFWTRTGTTLAPKTAGDLVPPEHISFTQAGTGAVQRTVESKLQDTVSVKDFGAVGDGVTDDTAAIQLAIDSLQGSSKTLYIPDGRYLLSRAGTFFLDFASANKNYALRITDSLSIVADGKFLFATNGLTTRCSAFVFDTVSDFSFEGGHFESTEPNGTETKDLFNGVAVLANSCTNGHISNVNALDTSGCVLALSSKAVTISNCFYSKLGTVQSGSSFGIYGGTGNLIERCVTYGGTQDGDTGLYGAGSFNRISLCKAHAFKITDATQTPVSTALQGIFVDAQQNNATVESCFAQGYYYGIDVKSNISNCFVLGNTLYKNKVGIAARRGEVGTDNMDVSIQDNLIIPVTGNGDATSINGYTVVGILIEDFASTLIQGNEFTTSYNTAATENWVAVLTTSKIFNASQRGVLSLNNNKIKYSQTSGGNTSQNTQTNYFDLNGYTNASLQILGNSFSHRNESAGRITISTFRDALVSGNSVADTVYAGIPNIPFVVLDEVQSALINGNSLSNSQGLVSYTKATSTESRTSQLVVSGNTFASTGQANHTMIQTDGVLGCVISGNIRFRPDLGAPFGDSKLLVSTNATATSKFALVGNVLRQTNYGASNYYTIDGVDAATGANILVNDMV